MWIESNCSTEQSVSGHTQTKGPGKGKKRKIIWPGATGVDNWLDLSHFTTLTLNRATGPSLLLIQLPTSSWCRVTKLLQLGRWTKSTVHQSQSAWPLLQWQIQRAPALAQWKRGPGEGQVNDWWHSIIFHPGKTDWCNWLSLCFVCQHEWTHGCEMDNWIASQIHLC